MNIPKDISDKVFARIVANPSKTVWLEKTAGGEYLIHASAPRSSKKAEDAAIQRGSQVFLFPGA